MGGVQGGKNPTRHYLPQVHFASVPCVVVKIKWISLQSNTRLFHKS